MLALLSLPLFSYPTYDEEDVQSALLSMRDSLPWSTAFGIENTRLWSVTPYTIRFEVGGSVVDCFLPWRTGTWVCRETEIGEL